MAGDDALSFRLFGTAAQAWMTFRDSLDHSQSDAFDVHLSLTGSCEDEDLDRLSQLAISKAPDADEHDGTISPDLGQLVGDAATPTGWISDLQRHPAAQSSFLPDRIGTALRPGPCRRRRSRPCSDMFAACHLWTCAERHVQASRGGDVGKGDIELEMAGISDAVYDDHMADWRALRATAENVATTAFLRLWDAGSPLFSNICRAAVMMKQGRKWRRSHPMSKTG